MKKLTLIITALSASLASAATVSVSSTVAAAGSIHGAVGAQVALKDHTETILPAGMRIRVGFFVGYNAAMDLTLRQPGAAIGLGQGPAPQFVPLGEPPTRVGYGDDTSATNLTKTIAGSIRWNTSYTNVSYAGASGDPADDNTIATGGVARGTRLFVLVYNTGALNPDFSAPGFEYGLFSDASFVVPDSGTATLSISMEKVDQASEVYYGALGNSLHLAPLAPVPEPATSVMAVLAGLGLMARRRR